MPTLNQTQSGKAFEYALALAFSGLCETNICDNSAKSTAEQAYKAHSDQQQVELLKAGNKAASFLRKKDIRLQNIKAIAVASDRAGQSGDVRDIIVTTTHDGCDAEVGISAKRGNDAIKHSRLSQNIDFGKKWMGHPCRDVYFEKIRPTFKLLQKWGQENRLFKDIEDKQDKIYTPILNAFEEEIDFIWANNKDAPFRLLHYLIGYHDFYWAIKENGIVSLLSCNIGGSLKWGKKWRMPTSIESKKRENKNRILLLFNHGWQLSFRLHNARSLCEPSLKLDVRIIGWPRQIARHEIEVG